MPNPAFFNLSEEKRNQILGFAVKEFATESYDTASVNQICKNARIAKGSFYQYFSDKLDLYAYVMRVAVEAKIKFFSECMKDFETLSLKGKIELLFLKGIEFGKEHSELAALGEQFSKENNQRAKAVVIREGERQSENLFIHMIDQAKQKGEIETHIDSLALSLLLQALNRTVDDYMKNQHGEVSYKHYDEGTKALVTSLLGIIFNGIKEPKN